MKNKLLSTFFIMLTISLFISNIVTTKVFGEKTMTQSKHQNRLKNSNSPYLLQHQDNPVDWYPWENKAFDKAKKEQKLIFLSIGYSTCHWCHVMEHESFEDNEVADFLNTNYVSIKVDREERPDIDKVYMDVCQAMTGSGGWPMTIIMTTDKIPLFAGTYFPKESTYGRPGLMDILRKIANAWHEKPEEILSQAAHIKEVLGNNNKVNKNAEITKQDIEQAAKNISSSFDSTYGGFDKAPKFPMGHKLIFLLRVAYRTNDKALLTQVEFTLKAMYQGGIFDHIGYGFCRYSTDKEWLTPHFEKMLYDNALLAMAYTEAWQITKNDFYKEVTTQIFDYILRDMTNNEGAFYSAENADSEGKEGTFYIFTKQEFVKIIGSKSSELLCEYFGVSASGNFEHGSNILHFPINDNAFFVKHDLDKIAFMEQVEKARAKLFEFRNKRLRPSLDDKVLVAWNGLMISAFAKAGRAMNEPKYIIAAKRASDFIITNMQNNQKQLLRSWRNGKTTSESFLSDYTLFTSALIDLYEADFDLKYLKEAIRLQDFVIENFASKDSGIFFETDENSEKLFMRPQNDYDGAMPSSLSGLAINSVKLSKLTGNTKYAKIADDIFKRNASNMKKYPAGFSRLLTALDMAYNSGHEIILAGKNRKDISALENELNKYYLPGSTQLFLETGNKKEINELVSYTKNFEENIQVPQLYLCKDYQCQKPIQIVDEIAKSLNTK